jgi:hypothetical protein
MESVEASTRTRETAGEAAADPLVARAREVVGGFIRWLDEFGETSQDQYDFWATRWGRRTKALYYRRPAVGSAAVAPFVFLEAFAPSTRALVRARSRFPIADAHYALGFLALARAEGDDRLLGRGLAFLDRLRATRCAGYDEYCWGYPFDWETSFGVFPEGCPLITTTPYAYEAFESGCETTGELDDLAILESIARFVFESIPSAAVAPGVEASAYTPYDRRRVVNASAYRAFLLTAAGRRFERPDWEAAGARNAAFVLHCQREDGSWPYAVDGRDDFVDNFHTCFVLKNLTKIWRVTGDEAVRDAIRRGYAFYRARLLEPDGEPRPFAVEQRMTLYRRDLYDYAEGINLSLLLEELEPAASGVLHRLLQHLFEDWVLPDGHFATRKLLVGRNTVPYHRWAQAQTFHALARVCELEPRTT